MHPLNQDRDDRDAEATPTAPRLEYDRRLAIRQRQVAYCETLDRRLSAARAATFLTGAGLSWAALGPDVVSLGWLFLPAAIFLGLVVFHERVMRRKHRNERAVSHYEQGLARLGDRWAGTGEPGTRFLDGGDPLAEDLDLFGRGSLFELLCTVRTRLGEDRLASWLRSPAEPGEIRLRHEALTELRPRLDLREEIALLGGRVGPNVDAKRLLAWAEAPAVHFPRFTPVAAGFLSVLTVTSIVLWQGFGVTINLFVLALALQGAFALRLRERVDRVLHGFDDATRGLALLSDVLVRFEQEPFSSSRLAMLRRDLETNGLPPSRRIAKLRLRADLLDSRRNQIFAIPAAILLWRTQLAISIGRWRAAHGSAVRRWVSAVAELEALLALAGYGYEHPDDPFPEITEEGPIFDGEGLAHPLLPEDRSVRNDLRLGGELRLLVVSGSNMSGKSTLLRTIGVNTVLALAGAPVRARRLRLGPTVLGTSIRVRDSLQEGRSRFYAEITRLREILDLTDGPIPVLFLLDEILHGTNSHDRRIGSEGVIRELLDRGAIGLVTTHDLALTQIADAFAPRAANVHFEDHLENGRMAFDYRLRSGIVRRSNALELMRAVGIDVPSGSE